ncbi:ABC transporter permease [Phyllobacterium sophorae]|nr:ABC transporter permease [Phyllobacterium sophorae]
MSTAKSMRQAQRPGSNTAVLGSRAVRQVLPLTAALLITATSFQVLSSVFLTPGNLVNLLTESSPLALVAVASCIMIIMGEIDLSLGSVAGLSAAIAASLMSHGMPWLPAILITLIAAAAIGLVHGGLVVIAGIRSFVVTLAGFLVCYGLQQRVLQPSGYISAASPMVTDLAIMRIPMWLSLGVVIAIGVSSLAAALLLRDPFKSNLDNRRVPVGVVRVVLPMTMATLAVLYLSDGGGIPVLTGIVLLITGLVWYLLKKTAGGRHLYAIGANVRAAQECGIRVSMIRWFGFGATSLLAGLAGISLLAYTGGADNTTGTGTLLLAAIGAAVVGGISLSGGRGSVWGGLAGALLLGAVQNGLNLLNLSSDMVYVVEGSVVVGALLVDALLRRGDLR